MRLDRDKRYQIKALLSAGLMQKEIAKLLDVKEPTLSREISRNGGRIGDLEIDLINSADHDANLLTVNDRMSNYCLIRYLPTKNADDLKKTLVRALRDYRKTFPLYTITSDNGKEFACHLDIAKALSPQKVRWIQDKLNNRPRKRFAFMTPLEYICMQVKQADRLR